MENLMTLWQVRERNFHKLGQQKAYWQVSIMHQKVGIPTTRFGRSKNAPPNIYILTFFVYLLHFFTILGKPDKTQHF